MKIIDEFPTQRELENLLKLKDALQKDNQVLKYENANLKQI